MSEQEQLTALMHLIRRLSKTELGNDDPQSCFQVASLLLLKELAGGHSRLGAVTLAGK